MPTVTYLGPQYSRAAFDGREWLRKVPRDVSKSWVEAHANHLQADCWKVEGMEMPSAPVVVKFTEDVEEVIPPASDTGGIPDGEWTRAAIRTWLKEQNVTIPKTYTTKAKLLSLVEEHLNPKLAEEQITE